MFEEMTKLKEYLQKSKTGTAPQQVSTIRTNIPLPAKRIYECSRCGRAFPSDLLKNQLVAEHGVAERASRSDAFAILSGGKTSVQELYDERPQSKPKRVGQKPPQPVQPNNKTTKQKVVRGGQQPKRIEGLDRNKNLDGYTEHVMKLPNGEDHRFFFKRTVHPPQKQHRPFATIHRVGTNDVNKTSTFVPKSISSGQSREQQQTPAQEKRLPQQSFRLSNPGDFKVPEHWVALGVKAT